jgi:transcription antitermination factor NusG
MLDPESRWFAVHTQPMREVTARDQLEAQVYRTFLPTRLKTVSHARKLRTIVAPFFPRYLFVVIDLKWQRWRSVNGTIGVASLVMQGDRPQPVPHGVVETLIASSDESGLMHFGQNLKVGDPVRLTAGPFAEQLGVLDRIEDSDRVRVLLEIMGTQVPVRVGRDCVAAAA